MTDTQSFEPAGRAIPFVDEGDGPAVVLVPERGLTVAYLETLAHMLNEADHRVVRIGSRRPGDAPATMHDLAQDVIDVMDHLGLGDAWVGGHGFGGSVARTVALDHTDRVNGVLLLGVEAPDRARVAAAEFDVPEALRDGDVEPLQRAAQDETPAADWSATATHVPVLIIQGSVDEVTPPADGEALQAAAAHLASVVSVDGGGHLFPATHAGPTAWAIEDYLDWD